MFPEKKNFVEDYKAVNFKGFSCETALKIKTCLVFL